MARTVAARLQATPRQLGLAWVQEGAAAVVLVGLVIGFGATVSVFLSDRNWTDIGRSYFVELAFLALAETLVLLTRGIDLSVGATLALAAVTVGVVNVDHHVDIWVAVAAALAVGLVAGLVNGGLVATLGLSPIVATLVTLTLYRGISLGLTGGANLGPYPASFTELGQGTPGGVPVQAIVLAVVAVLLAVVLARAVVGRWVYATGGNLNAARLAGVPVKRVLYGVYGAAGLLAGLAGVVSAARFGTARADFATGAELDAITAAILGGVSIAGGRGSIVWALAGALTIAVLRNGLTLLNQSGSIQIVAIGGILVAAVLADRVATGWRRRREIATQLARDVLRPRGRILRKRLQEGR